MSSSPKKRPPIAKVKLYAEFIGIDLDAHPYLYDLMEEGLKCPLPTGWDIRELPPDGDGAARHEFVHIESGKSQNAHPMDEVFIDRAKQLMQKHADAVLLQKSSNSKKSTTTSLTSMWSDSDDDELFDPRTGKRTKRPKQQQLGRFYRRSGSSSVRGKQIRYIMYCIAIAALLHFVTYRAFFTVFMQMGNNSYELEKARKEKAAGELSSAETEKVMQAEGGKG